METENIETKEDYSSTPATAQEVRALKRILFKDEARKVLGFRSGPYTETEILTHFYNLVIPKLENKTKNLTKFIDAKNLLLRAQIENQVEKNGKFELNIPFRNICKNCGGTGERYRFFPKQIDVKCNKCENGELIISCPACKGTGRYVKESGNLKINVKCNKCHKINKETGKKEPVVFDEKTGNFLVGKIKVKCRFCRGSGTFSKPVLDSYIRTTTPCKVCGGKGFHFHTVKEPDNPVISQDLGKVIKSAVAITE
jgi:hypothetical protein